MPELPEVQTIVNGLKPELQGKSIKQIEVLDVDLLRNTTPQELNKKLVGKQITDVSRTGKYILLEVAGGSIAAIHLRMSGKLLLLETDVNTNYQRISFYFKDYEKKLTMDNLRRLGTLDLLKTKRDEPLGSLGLDPFSNEYNWENFQRIFDTSRAIKLLLLDQKKITGLGNIYVNEVLFKAQISPTSPSQKVSKPKQKKLFRLIPEVLTEAIENNGTTLNDYRDSLGEEGNFQDSLLLYGKEGKPCPYCGTKIMRIKQGGRSTYLCPNCQANDND